jgi:hypothetical protein
MTGFDSKRKASLDTLDHIGYQGRESRPEELAPKPVAWMLASALDDLQMNKRVEVTEHREEPDDVPLYLHPAAPVPAVQSAARAIAAEQAEDKGLWFIATTVTEAHLQAALRRLAAAVEGEAPVARTPLTNEQVWMLATQCTVGSDLHIDKFVRAIEAAHGIGEKT